MMHAGRNELLFSPTMHMNQNTVSRNSIYLDCLYAVKVSSLLFLPYNTNPFYCLTRNGKQQLVL